MGTILADFVHISHGDGTLRRARLVDEVAMSSKFNTGGIRTERAVILMFSVSPSGVTGVPAQGDVCINDNKVGSILGTVQNQFTPQTIIIAKARDKLDKPIFESTDGRDNEFAIKNVPAAFAISTNLDL
jgi:hypothetical protein